MSQGSSTLDLCLLCFQSEEKGRSEQWCGFSRITKLENTIPKPWIVSILLFNQEKVKYIIRQIPHKIKSWHVMEKKNHWIFNQHLGSFSFNTSLVQHLGHLTSVRNTKFCLVSTTTFLVIDTGYLSEHDPYRHIFTWDFIKI